MVLSFGVWYLVGSQLIWRCPSVSGRESTIWRCPSEPGRESADMALSFGVW